MIWSSFSSLVLVDLTIVGLAAILLGEGLYRGTFSKQKGSGIGHYLLAAGISTTALYYLADLASITLLPALTRPEVSLAAMDFLLRFVRIPATVIAFALIVSGAILVARSSALVRDSMRRTEEETARSVEKIADSEQRFRSLVEQYSDSVYCFEFAPSMPVSLSIEEQIARSYDCVLVECNTAYAHALAVDSPAEIIGKSYGGLDSAFGTKSHDKLFRNFIKSGYRLVDHEVHTKGVRGDKRALLLNMNGVIKDGELLRVWGSEKNILAKFEAESGLQGRLRYQQLVADVSSRLITAGEDQISNALEASLKQIGYFGMADRVLILWFDYENRLARLLYHWTRQGEVPLLETRIQDFPWIASKLLRGDVVAIESVTEMPDNVPDKAGLIQHGIKSTTVIPVVIGGKVVGACNFAVTGGDSVWSDQDIWDMQILADILANVVNRLNSMNSLDAAMTELQGVKDRLEAENVYLRQEIRSTHGFNELVGESENLIRCLQQVAQVAPTDMTVLVMGETGTGKELIARAIHERSNRSDRALVKVNCAALPANLIENELFGHEKGAFSGADSRARGRFDLANGGTLFLDEIGDLPLDLQGKLLRVLQDGEFQRLGGIETIQVNVRIIAATNRRLQDAVDNGDFRADLFYRINTFPILLPPLRERNEDIPMLAEHFVSKHAPSLGKEVTGVSTAMMTQLMAYSWPGNVRELESVVQRALISANGPILKLAEPLHEDLQFSAATTIGTVANPLDLRSAEREHIASILAQTDWKIAGESGAAAKLGLPPSTLRSKMKKLGIQRDAPQD